MPISSYHDSEKKGGFQKREKFVGPIYVHLSSPIYADLYSIMYLNHL